MNSVEYVEEMEQARRDAIDTITTSMEANRRLYNAETEAGTMTPKLHKSLTDAYHNSRIEREMLLGNIPRSARKTKFRNGMYH